MVDIHWTVDMVSVDKMIHGLTQLFGPVGLSDFLNIKVGTYLQQRTQERFRAEGDDVSGPWAALAPYTVTVRSSEKFPLVTGEHPINVRTGELEEWATGGGGWAAVPHSLGATLQYPRRKPNGELKDKVETAQVGRAKPRTVPRPVIGVNEKDMLFLIAAFSIEVEEAVK